MNANWDSYEISGNKWGVPSYLARIHDTLPTSDRTAIVYMPYNTATEQSDGNLCGSFQTLWIARYGSYLIAGNNGSSSATVKLPSGAGVALELQSGNKYAMGSSVSVAAGGTLVFAMPIVTSVQPVPNGTYTMTNMSSNLVLDDPGSSTTHGAQMDQLGANGGANQQWTLTYNGSGYYTIQCSSSGLYLTDPSGSTSNGAQLQQNLADSSSDQLWQLIPSGAGYFFVNKAGGTEINDPSSSNSPGTKMVLWALDSGKNSVWSLQSTSAAVSQPLANGTYTMTCDLSNLVMTDPGSSTVSGTQMQQSTAVGGTNQQWVFTYNGSGYYTIKCNSSGLYLTDPSGSTGNGAPLRQQTADGAGDQLWSLVPDADGYVLINKTGGLDIDDPGGSQTAGQPLDLWAYGGGPNQIWHIQ
jgi:hypothetical protein